MKKYTHYFIGMGLLSFAFLLAAENIEVTKNRLEDCQGCKCRPKRD
jgi:hypothetical protein